MRPSAESADLDERARTDDDNQGGGGQGEEQPETEEGDSFAADDRAREIARALGGKAIVARTRGAGGVSLLALRSGAKR